MLLQSNHGPMICGESMEVAFDYLVTPPLRCRASLMFCMCVCVRVGYAQPGHEARSSCADSGGVGSDDGP